MIHLESESPEDLWAGLGRKFFSTANRGIDYSIANRRFFSFNNILMVQDWPKGWDNPYLFDIIGYSDVGTKMGILSRSYLIPEAWIKFKQALETYDVKNRRVGIKAFGMPFHMNPEGKGGCLSSFHLLQKDKEIHITIHMKVAELPRKFVADLRFISYLIANLDLPQKTYKVTFMLSNLYYSIIGLRAYIPILGLNKMELHGLPIDEPRNYQVGVQEGIYEARKKLIKEWGKAILQTGIHIDFIKDKRTICTADQIESLTSWK